MELVNLRKAIADDTTRESVTTTEAPSIPIEIERKIFALTEGKGEGAAERLLTSERLLRRDLEELERIYFLDQSIFQGINLIANHITAPGYTLEGKDESRAKVKEFLQGLGMTTTLNRLARHTLIFGTAYGEIVYNKLSPPTKIIDFVTIDPKSIDLIRDMATGIPKFDEDGELLGWVQKAITGKKKIFKKIDGDVKPGHWPKIIPFSLYELSMGARGIGLIEPLYKSEKIKLNLEHSFGEVAHRIGLPIIWAKIGDEFHHPTDDQIRAFGAQLKAIHTKNQIVTDETVDIQLIQPKDISPLENVLNYFKSNVSSGLGIPELLLYGSGAGVNRATSEALLEQFFRNIVTLQALFAEKVQLLINRFCELEGITEVPKLGFKDPRPERLNEFAIRMERYTKAGLLEPSSLESYIRDVEELPTKPEVETEAKKTPDAKPEEELKPTETEPLPRIEQDLSDNLEKSYNTLVEQTVKTLQKYGK